MSLKPQKKSEQRKLEEKLKAKKRDKQMPKLPPYILIVSEGTKTEPFYLEGFANAINEKYRRYTRNPRIQVHGTGRNTMGLYEYIEQRDFKTDLKEFEQIWLVYDKDDFPSDRFDNAAFKAAETKNSRFHVAWSNESFELWLLWHFQDYTSCNHRTEYIRLLESHLSGDYSKGDESIYREILDKGNLGEAIRRSKQQIAYYKDCGITTPSQMVTASTVYELIEELKKYL